MLRRLFLSTPKRQAFTYIFIVFITYFALSRPVEFSRDVAILGDYAYLASEADGLRVIDISNSENPVAIKHFPVNNKAYAVELQDNLLFLAAGKDGLKVYSLNDPGNPLLLGEVASLDDTTDVHASGRYVYIADGGAGVRVFELSKGDNFSLRQIGQYQTKSRALNLQSFEKELLVSESNKDVIILNVNNPSRPSEIGIYDAKAVVRDIQIRHNLAYLAAGERGLVVINISNPAEVTEVSVYDTQGSANGISLHGDQLYLANGESGVRVLNTYDVTNMHLIGSYDTPGEASALEIRDGITYVADGYSGLVLVQLQPLIDTNISGSSQSRMTVEKVVVAGTYAYLVAGEDGLRIMDVSNPASPVEINAYRSASYVAGVALGGDLAYLATKSTGLQLIDISNPTGNLTQISTEVIGEDSYAVAVSGDYVYLADGQAGLKVIDDTIPTGPVEVGMVDTPGNAFDVEVSGQYAYVADGQAGLRVIDVSNPQQPVQVGYYDSPGDAQAVAIETITIAAQDEDSGMPSTSITYAYLADGSRGLRVLDVTNPSIPVLVGVNESPSYVQDVAVSGPTVYVAGREQGLLIFNTSDPTNPILTSTIETPGRATGVDVEGMYAYVADFERGLRIIDIANITTPFEVGFFDSPEFAKDISLVDPYAYVTDGQEGMWSLNITNINSISSAGFYPTPGQSARVSTFGGFAYVADGEAGVQIVDISTPPNMIQAGAFDTPGTALDIYVVNTTAYVADGVSGLQIYDVTNPAQVAGLGRLSMPGMAQGVTVAGEYAYLANGLAGLQVVKISDPRRPSRVGVVSEIKDARRVVVAGEYAYLAGGVEGMQIVNVSLPLTPELVTTFPTPSPVEDIYVLGNVAFLAIGAGGIQIVDIHNPADPLLIGEQPLGGTALGVETLVRGPSENRPVNYEIYVAAGGEALVVLQGDIVLSSTFLGVYETPGTATLNQIVDQAMAVIRGDSSGRSEKVVRTMVQFFFDWFIIGLGGLILWLAFFAQFTLPVSGIQERVTSIDRLMSFLMGRHGPALHVREGKVIWGAKEQLRRGPGVVLTDLSSAIILARRGISSGSSILTPLARIALELNRLTSRRKSTEQKARPAIRVEGPGLVFTGPHPGGQTRFDEKVLGVADLRPQIRMASNIHGYTRDGIEVTTHIYTLFTLGQPADTLRVAYVGKHLPENLRVIYLEDKVFTNPEDGKPVSNVKIVKDLVDELDPVDKDEIHRIVHSSGNVPGTSSKVLDVTDQPPGAPFHFDSKRVFAAIAAEAQDVDRGEPSDWTELPARVATEVFRNMLAREVYDVLYMPSKPDEYPIQEFKSNFAHRVRNLGVLNYQYIERIYGGEFKKGQEWDEDDLFVHPKRPFRQPKVLRARGIKVITAGFTELKPVNPGIYQQRLDNWRARWEREEVAKRTPYDFEALRIRDKARIKGQRDLAQALARILSEAPYTHDDLVLRLFQALQTAAANPATRKLLPDSTIHLMGVLGNWLIEEDDGQDEP